MNNSFLLSLLFGFTVNVCLADEVACNRAFDKIDHVESAFPNFTAMSDESFVLNVREAFRGAAFSFQPVAEEMAARLKFQTPAGLPVSWNLPFPGTFRAVEKVWNLEIDAVSHEKVLSRVLYAPYPYAKKPKLYRVPDLLYWIYRENANIPVGAIRVTLFASGSIETAPTRRRNRSARNRLLVETFLVRQFDSENSYDLKRVAKAVRPVWAIPGLAESF
jgi:hypothetical protein